MPREQKNKGELASKQSSPKKLRSDDLVTDSDEVIMRLNQMLMDLADRKLELWVEYGLESREYVNGLKAKYQYYIPLKTTDVIDGGPFGAGRGLNIRGKHESQMRLGRTSMADDPIANLLRDTELSVIRGEKTKVLQRLEDLLAANPDPGFAQVDPPAQKRGLTKEGVVGTVPDPSLYGRLPDNVVAFKRDGEVHHIVFNEQFTKLAQALSAESTQNIASGLNALRTFNRYLTGTLTRWNLAFLPVNVQRDIATGYIHNLEQGWDFANGALKRLPSSYVAAARYNKGVAPSTKADHYYHEYVKAGGPISTLGLAEDQIAKAKELQKAIDGLGSSWARSVSMVRRVFGFVETINDIGENGTRFASYMEARERGWSIERAASYAKNLTTNFERKGEIGAVLSAAYIFANAGIQGTARSIQAIKSPRVAKAVVSMSLAMVVLDGLNAAWSDEDDEGNKFYDKIPDWKKRTSLIFMLPGSGGKYLSIPLPQSISPLFYFGTTVGEMVRGRRGPMEATASWMEAATDQWNVLGGGSDLIETALPTVMDPVYVIGAERTPFGTPLMPFSFDPDTPDSQRYWSRTSSNFVDFAQWMNRSTGGDEITSGMIDVSPETLAYLTRFLFGGIGAESMRTGSVFSDIAAGKAPKLEDVPAVRRYVGDISEDDRYDKGMYSEAQREIRRYQSALNRAKTAGSGDTIARLRRDYPGYDRLNTILRRYDSKIKKLKKAGKDAEAATLMRKFNNVYRDVTE